MTQQPDDRSGRRATGQDKRYWLDDPRNVTKLVYGLLALCAASVLADLFYEKHVHYGVEKIIGAYGLYGFLGCAVLVLGARELRKILKRDENYYRDDD